MCKSFHILENPRQTGIEGNDHVYSKPFLLAKNRILANLYDPEIKTRLTKFRCFVLGTNVVGCIAFGAFMNRRIGGRSRGGMINRSQ